LKFRHDFNRSCLDHIKPVFPPSGELVDYFQCLDCGLIFTVFFDHMNAAEMARRIYNDDYVLVDPEFESTRPRFFARLLDCIEPGTRGQIRLLDFGGGRGGLARLLHGSGFACLDSYDPFFGETALPARLYDLITAFEVFEHADDPIGTASMASSLLAPSGLILFSTHLQPATGVETWWYIAPRNGHISIHTRRSLLAIARRLHLGYLPIDDGLHAFYREPIGPAAAAAAGPLLATRLHAASLEGPRAYFRTVSGLLRLGRVRAALRPRHAIRMLAAAAGYHVAAAGSSEC